MNGKRIADFGSGTGYLIRLIDQQAEPSKLVGIDSYPKFNELAKKMCPAADYYESLDQINGQFDLIFCTEVLEHLVNPGRQLRALAERLQPAGTLVLTVPNGRTDRTPARAIREDGTGYWGHINFWSPESWHIFLTELFPDDTVKTGVLPSQPNFAIVQRNEF